MFNLKVHKCAINMIDLDVFHLISSSYDSQERAVHLIINNFLTLTQLYMLGNHDNNLHTYIAIK